MGEGDDTRLLVRPRSVSITILVGILVVAGLSKFDSDFNRLPNGKVFDITPVTGGVGPMTVRMLKRSFRRSEVCRESEERPRKGADPC